jgi:hypothetical protein
VANPQELRAVSGVAADLAGYRHTIDNYAIIHALKTHGVDTPRRTSGVPITPDDFVLVPDILQAPDRIMHGGRAGGTERIGYVKQFEDRAIYYVEEVRTSARKGKRELALKTMWNRRGGDAAARRPDAPSGALGPTSETGQATTPKIATGDGRVEPPIDNVSVAGHLSAFCSA